MSIRSETQHHLSTETGKTNTKPDNYVKYIIKSLIMPFIHLFFISIYINLSVIFNSIFVEQVIDRVSVHKQISTLLILYFVLIIQLSTAGVLSFYRHRILYEVATKLDNSLRECIAKKYLTAETLGSSDNKFITLISDLDQFVSLMSGKLIPSIYDLMMVPLYVIILFTMHRYLGYMACIFIIIACSVNLYAAILDTKNEYILLDLNKESFHIITDSLSMSKEIQMSSMYDYLKSKWILSYASRAIYNKWYEANNYIVHTLKRMLLSPFPAALVILAATLSVDLELSPGNAIGCMLLGSKMLQSIANFTSSFGSLLSCRQIFKKLSDSLEIEVTKIEFASNYESDYTLFVDNLSVRDPSSGCIMLKNLSFILKRGGYLEVVCIDLDSGTALCRVLAGVWAIFDGSIVVKRGLKNENSDSAARIGYFPRNLHFFSDTIFNNIAWFRDITFEVVIDASNLAGLHDEIMSKKDQYRSFIRGDGHGYSKSFMFRLGLARAICDRPDIVILDVGIDGLQTSDLIILNNVIADLLDRNIAVICSGFAFDCDKLVVQKLFINQI